jgi:nicotinate phosphoribosyltransferase
VTSADRPALDIAYKLVAYAGRPVAKFSADKASLPGAKQVFRNGDPTGDVLALRHEERTGRPLLQRVWTDGTPSYFFDRERARTTAATELDALTPAWSRPVRDADPPRPLPTAELVQLAEGVRSATSGTT